MWFEISDSTLALIYDWFNSLILTSIAGNRESSETDCRETCQLYRNYIRVSKIIALKGKFFLIIPLNFNIMIWPDVLQTKTGQGNSSPFRPAHEMQLFCSIRNHRFSARLITSHINFLEISLLLLKRPFNFINLVAATILKWKRFRNFF